MQKLKIVDHQPGEPVHCPDGYSVIYEDGKPYLIKK